MKHLFRLILLLCVAALLVPTPQPTGARARQAATEDSRASISYVGSLGGQLRDVYVDGALAYLIEGATLTILDTSDPTALRVYSRTPLLEQPDRLVAAGGFVYLSSSYALAVLIYDARDPAAPVQVYRLQFGETEYPFSLTVANSLLWVPVGDKLLYFDLQNPARPALLGSLPGSAAIFQVSGPLVYLLNGYKGLQIWDLTDPRSPTPRGEAAPLDPAEGYFYRGLALSGSRAYIAVVLNSPDRPDTSFVLTLDVRDPAKPALLATAVADAEGLSLSGGRLVTLVDKRLLVYDMANPNQPALLADRAVKFYRYQVAGPLIYGLWFDEWSITDIGDPAAPAVRGQYRVNSGVLWVDRITREGSRLYVRTPDSIQIVDVSNPISPTLQGAVPTESFAARYQIDGARLLVPSSAGLKLVDASDPISPTARFTFGLGRTGRMVGDLAYIVTDTGLQLYDISDLGQPVQLADLPIVLPKYWQFEQVLVAGGRAYIVTPYPVACGRECYEPWLNVWVLDVSDPQRPRLGGNIDVKLDARYSGAALSGTTLLVAAAKLLAIDASAFDSPKLSEVPYEGSADSLAVVGQRAYLTGGGWLTTLDLADPLHPKLVSRFRVSVWSASDIQTVGGLAYVRGDALRVLDVRDPATPLPRAVYPMAVQDFAVIDSYIYLSLGDGGLRIVQLHPERFVKPLLLPLVRKK
jgi:hypothetical protein